MRAYARGDAVWKASFIAGLLTKQIWQKQELSEQREESKTSVWLYRVATEEDEINCRSSERRAKLQFGSTESRRKKMKSTVGAARGEQNSSLALPSRDGRRWYQLWKKDAGTCFPLHLATILPILMVLRSAKAERFFMSTSTVNAVNRIDRSALAERKP